MHEQGARRPEGQGKGRGGRRSHDLGRGGWGPGREGTGAWRSEERAQRAWRAGTARGGVEAPKRERRTAGRGGWDRDGARRLPQERACGAGGQSWGGGGPGNEIPRAGPFHPFPVRAPRAPTFRALPALAHGGCRHIARGGGGGSRKERRGRELAVAEARAAGARGGARRGTDPAWSEVSPCWARGGRGRPKPCARPAGPAARRPSPGSPPPPAAAPEPSGARGGAGTSSCRRRRGPTDARARRAPSPPPRPAPPRAPIGQARRIKGEAGRRGGGTGRGQRRWGVVSGLGAGRGQTLRACHSAPSRRRGRSPSRVPGAGARAGTGVEAPASRLLGTHALRGPALPSLPVQCLPPLCSLEAAGRDSEAPVCR